MGPAPSMESPVEEIVISRSWIQKKRCENSMFLNEDSKNIEILVSNKKEVIARYPGHRETLKYLIPPRGGGNVIRIDGHSPEIVEQVLRYCYEDYINFDDWKAARDVLIMAADYRIPSLIAECAEFLKDSITLRNACYLLDLAVRYDLSELQSVCLKFCCATAFIVLRTKAFYESSEKVAVLLTQSSQLSVENELSVFNALWKWSKANCIRESEPLNDGAIMQYFKRVANCVGFQFLSIEQKSTLPKNVRDHYKAIQRQPSNFSQIRNKRMLQHVEFTAISTTLLFTCKKENERRYISGSKVTLVKFSLDIDSYLLEVSTVCLKDERTAVDPKEVIRKLKIVSETGVEFSWDETTNKVDFQILGGKLRKASVYDTYSNAVETQYRTAKFLLLHAGVYEIEVDPKEANIKWPITTVTQNRKRSDIRVVLCSEAYGLESLKFLQAY